MANEVGTIFALNKMNYNNCLICGRKHQHYEVWVFGGHSLQANQSLKFHCMFYGDR